MDCKDYFCEECAKLKSRLYVLIQQLSIFFSKRSKIVSQECELSLFDSIINLNQMNINKNQVNQDDNDEEEFEIIAVDHLSSPQDAYFDKVVGELQQIIFDSSFESIQSHFMKNAQENKNQYMDIFKLYQKQVESFVEKSLHSRIAEFDMPKFLGLLQSRSDQIDENILDMLQSFTDFEVFKQIMLDYKSYLSNEENLKGLTIKSNRLS